MVKRRILFISSVNLAINPRILKEILLAHQQGYHVDFLGFTMDNWTNPIELSIQESLPSGINLTYLSATRKPFIPWLVFSVLERMLRKIHGLIPNSLFLGGLAISKRSIALFVYLLTQKKYAQTDLVVAHTMACIYPASVFARMQKSKLGVDFEDFYPGEHVQTDEETERNRRILVIKKTLNKAAYVSAAAPLIAEEVRRLLPLKSNQINAIGNAFSAMEFTRPVKKTAAKQKLSFVWFSQNIDLGRGLEMILPVFKTFPADIELTLIGNLNSNFRTAIQLEDYSNVKIIPPVTQLELHKLLSGFDIGLALELSDRDQNRDIALTNKIMAYFQAGLFILATDTRGQTAFINDHPEHGILINQVAANIQAVFGRLIRQQEDIRNRSQERFTVAQKFSWEEEQKKLVTIWGSLWTKSE